LQTTQSIDYAEAKAIVDAIAAKCMEMGTATVIAVSDPHGELIAFARMDGAPITSIRIAENKAWTAARSRTPTKDIGDRVRSPDRGFDIAYFGDPRFVGWGGGIPVWRNGVVVGAVAVSGLTSAEDVELAAFGATLIAGN